MGTITETVSLAAASGGTDTEYSTTYWSELVGVTLSNVVDVDVNASLAINETHTVVVDYTYDAADTTDVLVDEALTETLSIRSSTLPTGIDVTAVESGVSTNLFTYIMALIDADDADTIETTMAEATPVLEDDTDLISELITELDAAGETELGDWVADTVTELNATDEMTISTGSVIGDLRDILLKVDHADTITASYKDYSASVVTVSTTAEVDMAAPVIENVTLVTGTATLDTTPKFTAEVTDADTGVDDADIHLWIYIGSWGEQTIAPDPIVDGYEVEYTRTTALTDGDYDWYLVATDEAGNEARVDSDVAPEGYMATIEARIVTDSLDIASNTVAELIAALDTADEDDEASWLTDLAAARQSWGAANQIDVFILHLPDYTFEIDSTDPKMEEARAGIGYEYDEDADVYAEVADVGSIRVEFSDELDAGTVDADDFDVSGSSEPSEVFMDADLGLKYVYLTVADMDTDATPDVELTGQVSDAAGNVLTASEAAADDEEVVEALDYMEPVLSGAVSPVLGAKDDEITIGISSTEKLTKAPPTKIGLLAKTSVPETHTATGAQTDFTLDNGYVYEILSAYSVSNTVTHEVTIVDAVAGTITVDPAVADGAVLSIEYEYLTSLGSQAVLATDTTTWEGTKKIATTGKHVVWSEGTDKASAANKSEIYTAAFEGDTSAPGLTIKVGDIELTTDVEEVPYLATQWITLEFDDEEEYYGDSYDEITVTEATLDGEDVLAQLGTTDNITYILTVALAEGEHTVAVTGEDAAGNERELSRDFDITEPETLTIDLKPGWNLISIPSELVDPSTSVVFEDMPTVTNIRYYNAEALGKWRGVELKDGVWTRELGYQALSNILPGVGYWVYSTGWDTLEVSLAERAALEMVPTYVIKKGWNMIGFASIAGEDSMRVNSYLTSIADITVAVYSYDPSPAIGFEMVKGDSVSSNWSLVWADTDADTIGDTAESAADAIAAGDTIIEAMVEAGKGYWLYVTDDGRLVP